MTSAERGPRARASSCGGVDLYLQRGVRARARVNASVDSGGALTYKSLTPRVCKVGSAGKVTALSRGTCRVRINVSANGDYDAGKLVVFTTVRR